MLNYDEEADRYDVTRGGDARAEEAATAVRALLPAGAAVVADLACGTGIVTMRLDGPGRRIVGVDRSLGMARVAAARLPHQITIGDVTRLPLADASVDAVVMIWLLHLLNERSSVAALAEAVRILRPGGVLLTTVDKGAADFAARSDITDLIGPIAAYAQPKPDAADRVTDLVAELGLTATGQTTFTGTRQGRSPRQWRDRLLGRAFSWVDDLAALCERLEELPDQDRPRPDPVYRLVRFTKRHRQARGPALECGAGSRTWPGSISERRN